MNHKLYNKRIENPDTKRLIKISTALTYDENSPVYKLAKSIIDKTKNRRSNLGKSKFNQEIIKKYGKLKLTSYPSSDIDTKDIEVNESDDIDSHYVLKWTDPKTGRTILSYTKKFLERNAKIKWNRIKKVDENSIKKIDNKVTKLLNRKNKKISDSAAVIKIILETGLRPGSHSGYEDTGNRGVITLHPNNVKIEKDKISICFIGKSYQENTSVIVNKELANYLKRRLKERHNGQFLFETDIGTTRKIFNSINKKFKLKDLRTYTATKMASNILNNREIPEDIKNNPKNLKKVIKNILKETFEQVSQKLNNTPAMAKSSYIHPEVIKQWLERNNITSEQ